MNVPGEEPEDILSRFTWFSVLSFQFAAHLRRADKEGVSTWATPALGSRKNIVAFATGLGYTF